MNKLVVDRNFIIYVEQLKQALVFKSSQNKAYNCNIEREWEIRTSDVQ